MGKSRILWCRDLSIFGTTYAQENQEKWLRVPAGCIHGGGGWGWGGVGVAWQFNVLLSKLNNKSINEQRLVLKVLCYHVKREGDSVAWHTFFKEYTPKRKVIEHQRLASLAALEVMQSERANCSTT